MRLNPASQRELPLTQHVGPRFTVMIEQLQLMDALSRCIGVSPDDFFRAGNLDDFGLRGAGGVIAEDDVPVRQP